MQKKMFRVAFIVLGPNAAITLSLTWSISG